MKRSTISYLLLAAVFSFCYSPASAQQSPLTTRSFVPLPQVLGMGDAAVTLPTQQSAFFYNPAHAAQNKFHVTIVGVQLSASNTFPDQISFFKDELQPAIDEGIDNLDNDRLKTLYDQTLEIGRQSTFLNLNVLAPAVSFRAGPVGVGLGVFGSSAITYRFPDGGGGLPQVQMVAMADAMAVGSAGVSLDQFGVSGLSVGVTAKYTQRYATLKNKPLDAISSEEAFDLYVANRASADLGFMYEVPLLGKLPGKLHVGLTLYDILGAPFAFEHDQTLQGTSTQATIDADIDAANTLLAVEPSFRFGVGYTLPQIPGGLVKESGVSIDYVGNQRPDINQAFFAHLRVGAQVKIKVLSVRAGLHQGYPTVGGGLSLGFMDLDYAYFGVEQGRYPGQLPSWHHAAQLRFGL